MSSLQKKEYCRALPRSRGAEFNQTSNTVKEYFLNKGRVSRDL
jgi:hypothetical protein